MISLYSNNMSIFYVDFNLSSLHKNAMFMSFHYRWQKGRSTHQSKDHRREGVPIDLEHADHW